MCVCFRAGMEMEWKKAQSIEISVDLVSAAKRQLQFLAAVDRKRWLYEGRGLERAITRYNTCWLPLLAKHSESPLCEGPLVVPFDCEWIWHCHRLNPVVYKSDCEEFYGRILDNSNVVSTVGGTLMKSSEDIWKNLYPDEPYELDLADALNDNSNVKQLGGEKCTMYDLVSAVQRQSPFFYQVSRLHMNNENYLEGAVARYKGFLHLIKRNKERFIKSFSVPTYDIDLIWHTHQLHPVSYCKELVAVMGKVLEHDDSDSDRTKGQKLDVGFSGTTKNWEELYGSRYWRAGAMYKGSNPLPVRTTPYSGFLTEEMATSDGSQSITLPEMKVVEVMLEFVDVRNLPEGHKGSLLVFFSKTQPDAIFNAKRSLTILTESGDKQVASFNCEPTGHLILELMSCIPSSLPVLKSYKTMGSCSIHLEHLLAPGSCPMVEKWVELVPSSNRTESKQIGLRVAVSVTTPTPTTHVLRMIRTQPFMKSSCLFPRPGRNQLAKSWTRFVNEAGDSIISLKIRGFKKFKGKKTIVRRKLVGIMQSGETCLLAEFADSKWAFVNSPWFLKFPNSKEDDGHLLELFGPQNVRLFSGGRLDYESTDCLKHKHKNELESHLMTAVEFSAEHPYGRAVALLDMKSGTVKVKDEWFLLPAIILSFMLSNVLITEMHANVRVHTKEAQHSIKEINLKGMDGRTTTDSGGCGGCGGGGCGNMASCGGCGGGCGSGCGGMAKNGGCGGCGGGCGGMAKNGGCGGCGSGGCGGSCGNKLADADGEADQSIIQGNEILVA
ncbi:glycine-rich domain-containing protein 1-like isoform X2 [Primulina huaijiensis]|uniref:glycine-rich domain-containing protein 1-like isoform X2 n=1 Tax=Primulina huaijiensis TaxID=1492673 RepID=UPI003CC710ED